MSSATRIACLFISVGFFFPSHAADLYPADMGKEAGEAPSSFQVGGVTVQSLNPRSNCGEESDDLGDDVRQPAGDVGDASHAGASSARASEPEVEIGFPLSSESQSSYYLRYLAHDNDDEEQKADTFTQNCGFSYLRHPADVILHSWGRTLPLAFERIGLALFHYMTDIRLVKRRQSRRIQAKGRDMKSLLFSYLTELLNLYNQDYFMASKITVESLDAGAFTATALAEGEKFDRTIHTADGEVKAITMHEMDIWQRTIVPGETTCAPSAGDDAQEACVELFATVDI